MKNEPILGYLPGSSERADLERALSSRSDVTADIPIVIAGKEYRTDNVQYQVMVSLRADEITSSFVHGISTMYRLT